MRSTCDPSQVARRLSPPCETFYQRAGITALGGASVTYCLALNLDQGLVLLSDSRTNAGVDNISTFGKMFTWSSLGGVDGAPPRAVAAMVAGNLSITQEVMDVVDEHLAAAAAQPQNGLETVLSAPTLFRVADYFGRLMADVQARRGPGLSAAGVSSGASLIVAGQIGPQPPGIFLVYAAGNFIEATRDVPFLQIGEFKYGKPILDRVVSPEMTLSHGVSAALLSMDATLRSNLSVGLPLDLAVLPSGAAVWSRRRVSADDVVFRQISDGWAEHLKAGFQNIPDLPLQGPEAT